MIFPLDLENVEWYVWALAGLFCICFFVQLYYYLHYYTGVLSQKKSIKKQETSFLATTPAVSVIICAKNESDNLIEFLPAVLQQDYPNFEVIVVNDGSTDETNSLLANMKTDYPNLYYTYVPEQAQVLSSKKLAITIGVKAAKNDLLLFIDADCKPSSSYWIRGMVENFVEGRDIVLGYGAYEQKRGLLSHLISFDTFFIALQYMGFALKGKPYMGVGRNLAYRKKVFYDMKGFASILHLQSGDDDLFVNKAANSENVRVAINPESVTISKPKENFKQWILQKERHLSTGSCYKTSSKTLLGGELLSRGLFYLSFVALIVLTLAQPLLLILAAVIFLLRYTTQAIVINLSAKHFRERKFYLSLLLFDFLLPIISLFILIENKLRRKTKYRWK